MDEPFNVTLALNDSLEQWYRHQRIILFPQLWEEEDETTGIVIHSLRNLKIIEGEDDWKYWINLFNVTLALNDSLGQVVQAKQQVIAYVPRTEYTNMEFNWIVQLCQPLILFLAHN